MKRSLFEKIQRLFPVLVAGFVLAGACTEFYQIAWGTGTWQGEFSRTWAFLYYSFVLFCALLFLGCLLFTVNQVGLRTWSDRIIKTRHWLGKFRWILWLAVFIAPVWLFQFTVWGVILQKVYIRILVWMIVVSLLSIFATRGNHLVEWRPFLTVLILTAGLFSIAASLRGVNNYPFSQGWSEGNRLWDYSVLFGRDRYMYPPEKDIPVYLDFGRQFIGGLSFLLPNATIVTARLWVGLIQVFPYLLLGVALFRIAARDGLSWFLLTLWTFLFLKQGPIHPPLVISAALVALAWRAPLWLAIPLVLGAGYFAQASRFTWIFAPGMWIFMLEMASASFLDRKTAAPFLKRAILLAFFGFLGGVFLASLISSVRVWLSPPVAIGVVSTPIPEPVTETPMVETPVPVSIDNPYPPFIQFVINALSSQPLLWYRLLPNSTYGNGILLALLYAVGPTLIILYYISVRRIWQVNILQKLSLLLPLLAFLAVGLVASTKIGGGGDLHNMDMFLIGLLFTIAVAWVNGGREWVLDGTGIPSIMKTVIVFSLVNSSLGPLQAMRSFNFGEDVERLMILTDTTNPNAMDMLPTQETVDLALQTIQAEVDNARVHGEILFMDQRQLLTFGYISNVPLVPEYEKKRLMDEALGGNSSFFESFYADLAAHRFALIVSEPLRTPIKDSSYQFGEENNAWVTWVSTPVLCYYEPKVNLAEVGVQLLVPKSEAADCSDQLP
jgi:hypothetical protein